MSAHPGFPLSAGSRTVPLSTGQSTELGDAPPRSGDFAERQPVAFTPVEPTVVAEVEVDTALDGPFGRVRHRGRLVRIRLDLHPEDVTTGHAKAQHGHAVADAADPLAEAGHR